jgi:glycerol kinase
MSESRYILALDQGTTSARAIVFDRLGNAVASAQQEIKQYYPQPGWVEHDPREIWQTQLAVARAALRDARATPNEIAAIGITNQRETTVVWERATGAPIGPAIVWQDRRTAAVCEILSAQGAAPLVQRKTGLVIDAYFSATKIAWLLDHVPGARARAERGELAFGTIDSWLVWNLTGGRRHLTDPSNAARTSLLNLRTLQWDDELLALFRVPRAVLPELVPSSGALAQTDAELFGASLPIAGIAGDQQAATFGQACLRAGMAKNTYGTGLFLLMNTGAQPTVSHHQLLSTVGWQLPSGTSYALEGSVFMGGATIQWLRDGLGLIGTAAEVEALAAQCASSEGVMLVPAFVGLGAPHWDPYARGTLCGLTRGSGRAHIARAALDAIALQTVDLVRAMEADANVALTELRVDGGASRNDLLMQIQADVLGTPVVRPHVTETTALGAAYLAGLAVGFWSGLDEIARQWREARRFEPAISASEREARVARWHEAIDRARHWERPPVTDRGKK